LEDAQNNTKIRNKNLNIVVRERYEAIAFGGNTIDITAPHSIKYLENRGADIIGSEQFEGSPRSHR